MGTNISKERYVIIPGKILLDSAVWVGFQYDIGMFVCDYGIHHEMQILGTMSSLQMRNSVHQGFSVLR